ncbi:hypothetical protein NP233_g12306 [Leucocoprinus birnbaumii]|uniref:DNA 3'-5' helicase n=1 Tax=Leucocoprinus birnbaumii TaxID=56174 RepID=A0AAD5VIN9_9AGAR|nr:hypothetical protein NP233_g12306 [Leucocoprinus birnbaumii]
MPAVLSKPSLNDWTDEKIIKLVLEKFLKRPCWYQIEVAKAVYAGKDVLGCAPTGAGKTLSFWIALLMAIQDGHKDKLLFVVSPLNVLAKQNVAVLLEAGISAIAVSAENATPETFKAIEQGKYNVVVINPEILMTSTELRELWNKSSFTKRILAFVFDEGHCITQWGKFRKHYLAVGILRYLISDPIPFYVASATLPPAILTETRKLLHMSRDNTVEILCSNDRPDISLVVRELAHPANSFRDLSFLVPYNWKEGQPEPRKFLIFFDDTKEAEDAAKHLRRRLKKKYHKKIRWFHSTMSQEYRERTLERYRRGELFGLCCTDAFGMGMDVPNVNIVAQFKGTCEFSTLQQRFGRAARAPGKTGVGILFVEKKDTVEGRKGKSTGSKRKAPANANEGHRRQRQRKPDKGPQVKEEDSLMTDAVPTPLPSTSTSTLPFEEQGLLDAWLADRRQRYRRPEIAPDDPTNKKKGKAPGVIPGTAIDDFINLPSYVPCRRIVPNQYFANDMRITDGHIRCDPDHVDGCQRCRPPLKAPCCDKCSPELLTQLHVPYVKPPVQRRFRIPALFTRGPQHFKLRNAIHDWRYEKAVLLFGKGYVYQLGADLLMDDNVLWRIVDCWSHGKISTTADLIKQTDWPLESIEACGQSLIDVLSTHSSMVPDPSVHLSQEDQTTAATPLSTSQTVAAPVLEHSNELPPISPASEDVEPLSMADSSTTSLSVLHPDPSLSQKQPFRRCSGCGEAGHNIQRCLNPHLKPNYVKKSTKKGSKENVPVGASTTRHLSPLKVESQIFQSPSKPPLTVVQPSSSSQPVQQPLALSSGLPQPALPSCYDFLRQPYSNSQWLSSQPLYLWPLTSTSTFGNKPG